MTISFLENENPIILILCADLNNIFAPITNCRTSGV
jgi:hypothetical protein